MVPGSGLGCESGAEGAVVFGRSGAPWWHLPGSCGRLGTSLTWVVSDGLGLEKTTVSPLGGEGVTCEDGWEEVTVTRDWGLPWVGGSGGSGQREAVTQAD